MQTSSRVDLVISGLHYPVTFILDWGEECPLFMEECEKVHKYLAGVFQREQRDTIPNHTVLIEVTK